MFGNVGLGGSGDVLGAKMVSGWVLEFCGLLLECSWIRFGIIFGIDFGYEIENLGPMFLIYL